MTAIPDYPWLAFDERHHFPQLSETITHLAGRCEALLEELVELPIKPARAQHLQQVYLSKGLHGTTAIEGNTLTEEEVQAILQSKSAQPKSRQYLVQEVLNLVEAYRQVERAAQTSHPLVLRLETIKAVHHTICHGLEHVDAEPGRFRNCRVIVGSGYRAPSESSAEITRMIEQLCHWMRQARFAEGAFLNGLLKAIVAHVYIAWIHPFQDGNGRTARTIEYGLLQAMGIPKVGSVLLANQYNLTRDMYMKRLDRASKVHQGRLIEFAEYALQNFNDGLTLAVGDIRRDVQRDAWHNYIYEVFHTRIRGSLSPSQVRARSLVLALEEPVSRQALALEFHHLYAGRSQKTLTRDLRLLAKWGLVTVEDGVVSPNTGVMKSFTLGERLKGRGERRMPPERAGRQLDLF